MKECDQKHEPKCFQSVTWTAKQPGQADFFTKPSKNCCTYKEKGFF